MNQLSHMALELLKIEEDLPFRMNYSRESPSVDDFDFYTFEQAWGSSALGFDGIGGCVMTEARTYVFAPKDKTSNQKCHVYFGGRFAYSVPWSRKFIEDVKNGCVASVSHRGRYIKTEGNDDF